MLQFVWKFLEMQKFQKNEKILARWQMSPDFEVMDLKVLDVVLD